MLLAWWQELAIWPNYASTKQLLCIRNSLFHLRELSHTSVKNALALSFPVQHQEWHLKKNCSCDTLQKLSIWESQIGTKSSRWICTLAAWHIGVSFTRHTTLVFGWIITMYAYKKLEVKHSAHLILTAVLSSTTKNFFSVQVIHVHKRSHSVSGGKECQVLKYTYYTVNGIKFKQIAPLYTQYENS